MPADVKKSADEVVEKVQAIFTPGIYIDVCGLTLLVYEALSYK